MQEIQKKKSISSNRWNIETARCRDTLPSPVGYSSQRAVIDSNQEKRVSRLLSKISPVLDEILMEHIDMKKSIESEL